MASFIGDFESRVATEPERLSVHRVIDGQIHHATMHEDFAVRHVNTGEWMESCAAAVGQLGGGFEIVRRADIPGSLSRARARE